MRSTVRNVPPAELVNYDPFRYDARRNPDGTFDLFPLLWADDAEYLAWQGDPLDDRPLHDEECEFRVLPILLYVAPDDGDLPF